MTDNQKKIFSLIAAAVLTLIIVVIWFSVGDNSAVNKTAVVADTKLSSFSPVQVIKDEFSKAFSNFKKTTADLDIGSTSDAGVGTTSVPVEIINN